jgi:hypothetical protein
MKKLKLMFIALALLAGIGGAVASRADSACEAYPQFYWTGGSYAPVQGDYGVGWYCEWNASATCTYYRPNISQPNFYVGCMVGSYRTVF